MAASGGPPQNDTKSKKEITPEQRKLYIQLGVIGVLALIAGAIYLPGLLGGSKTPAVVAVPPASETTAPGAVAPVDGSLPGATDEPGAAGAATTVAATTGSKVSFPVMRSRTDPFVRPYFIPTPTPIPPPPPPIPPPVSIPLPVSIPSPGEAGGVGGVGGIALPGGPGGGGASSQQLRLPPITIARLDESRRRPTDTTPPRRTAGTTGGGGTINPSFDKRLSGVVIGDGVRAILEIQRGTELVTHVVSPGDEVDGITILNIQRFNDGTRTVTRMIIRENGEERSVDLRPSTAGAGGAPGGPGQIP